MNNKNLSIKNKLLKELEIYFGNDIKRINHAKKVLAFAEDIIDRENADGRIVIPASILHDVGIKAAEAKYGSAAGCLQEREGPEIAKKILLDTDLTRDEITEICQIIGHHHSPGKIDTQNFKVLYDADWLVNIKDELEFNDKGRLTSLIAKVFLTDTGRMIAEKIYLGAIPGS